MRILNFSWDNSSLDRESKFAKRIFEYGESLDRYAIIVPAGSDVEIDISEHALVYGIASGDMSTFSARVKYLRQLYKIAGKLIKEDKYDIISTQDPFELALVGWLLRLTNNIGLHIQEHGDFFSTKFWRDESSANYVRFYLGSFLIKRADSIRVVSARIKQTLIKKFSIPENKIIAIPIFTNIDDRETKLNYQVLREKYRGKFIFLTMGRMVKQKNLLFLVRSFQTVSEKYQGAMLVFVGAGPEKYNIEHLAFELGLSNKIEFFDWTEDVYMWYETADAYVLTSNYEGWGRVIVEAANSSLPIIMTDVGCAGELIKDEESGLVVPIGDQEKLVEAMSKLLDDENLRKTLGDQAYQNLLLLPTKEVTFDMYKESWNRAKKI